MKSFKEIKNPMLASVYLLGLGIMVAMMFHHWMKTGISIRLSCFAFMFIFQILCWKIVASDIYDIKNPIIYLVAGFLLTVINLHFQAQESGEILNVLTILIGTSSITISVLSFLVYTQNPHELIKKNKSVKMT